MDRTTDKQTDRWTDGQRFQYIRYKEKQQQICRPHVIYYIKKKLSFSSITWQTLDDKLSPTAEFMQYFNEVQYFLKILRHVLIHPRLSEEWCGLTSVLHALVQRKYCDYLFPDPCSWSHLRLGQESAQTVMLEVMFAHMLSLCCWSCLWQVEKS